MTTRFSTPQTTALEQYARLSTKLSRFPLLLQKLHRFGPQAPEAWSETLQQILPHQAMIMLYREGEALLWNTTPKPSFQAFGLPKQVILELQEDPPLTLAALPQALRQVLPHEPQTPLLCAEVLFLQQPLGLLLWLSSPTSKNNAQDYQLAELLAEQLSALFAAWPQMQAKHPSASHSVSLSQEHHEATPESDPISNEGLTAPHSLSSEDIAGYESPSEEELTAPHSTSSIQRLQQRQSHPTPSRETLHLTRDTTSENPTHSQVTFPTSLSQEWNVFQEHTSDKQKAQAQQLQQAYRGLLQQFEHLSKEKQHLLEKLQQKDKAIEAHEQQQKTAQKVLQSSLALGEQLRQKLMEYAEFSKDLHEQLRELQTQKRLQTPEPYEQLNLAIVQILPKLQHSLASLEEHYLALSPTNPSDNHTSYQFTSTSRSLLNYLAQWSDYNRCLLGQVRPEISPFSILQLLEQLKRNFRPQLEHKSLSWRWDRHDLPSSELEGDEELVRSLLSLIVGYAIDQSPQNGHIQLYLRQEAHHTTPQLHLHFEHKHPILNPQELQILLEPFQEQADPVLIPRLSLALAKQLSRVHQGRLELQIQGDLLTVHLFLPIKLRKSPEKPKQPALDITRDLPLLPSIPQQWQASFVQQLRSIQPPQRSNPSMQALPPSPTQTSDSSVILRSPYTPTSQGKLLPPPTEDEPVIEFIELTPTRSPSKIELLQDHDFDLSLNKNNETHGMGQSSTYGQLDVLSKQFPLYTLPPTHAEGKSSSLHQLPHPLQHNAKNKNKSSSLIYCTPSGLGEELELSEGLRFLQYENHTFPDLEELARQAPNNEPRLILFGPEDVDSPFLSDLRTRIEGQAKVQIPMLERQSTIDFYRFHWGAYRSLPFSASHLLQWLQSVRIARPRQEKQLLVTGPSTLWGETAPLLQFFCGQRYRIHVEANPQTCARNLHRNPPDLLLVQIDQNETSWQDFFHELHHAVHLPSPPLLIFALTKLSQELSLLLQPLQQILFLPAERG